MPSFEAAAPARKAASTRPCPWMSANRYALASLPPGIPMKPLYRLALAALACLPSARRRATRAEDLRRRHGQGVRSPSADQAAAGGAEGRRTEGVRAAEEDREAKSGRWPTSSRSSRRRFDDPTIAATQKDAIRAEGQKTGQELQAKQAEGQQLMAKTQKRNAAEDPDARAARSSGISPRSLAMSRAARAARWCTTGQPGLCRSGATTSPSK